MQSWLSTHARLLISCFDGRADKNSWNGNNIQLWCYHRGLSDNLEQTFLCMHSICCKDLFPYLLANLTSSSYSPGPQENKKKTRLGRVKGHIELYVASLPAQQQVFVAFLNGPILRRLFASRRRLRLRPDAYISGQSEAHAVIFVSNKVHNCFQTSSIDRHQVFSRGLKFR